VVFEHLLDGHDDVCETLEKRIMVSNYVCICAVLIGWLIQRLNGIVVYVSHKNLVT